MINDGAFIHAAWHRHSRDEGSKHRGCEKSLHDGHFEFVCSGNELDILFKERE